MRKRLTFDRIGGGGQIGFKNKIEFAHFNSVREEGSHLRTVEVTVDILYNISKRVFRRFRFRFFKNILISPFYKQFSEMGSFKPIFVNFDENQTRRKQKSNKSF